MFRPTGQEGSMGASADLPKLSADLTSIHDMSPDGSNPDLNIGPQNNTFSEDEEEKSAAGSMLDGLIHSGSVSGSKVGSCDQEEEMSRDLLKEPESKKTVSSRFGGKLCLESVLADKDGQRIPEVEEEGDWVTPEVEDNGGRGTPEVEGKDSQRTPAVDGDGTAKEEGGGEPEVEETVKVDVQGSDKADVEELPTLSTAFSKYIIEKKKESEELKQKSKFRLHYLCRHSV